MDTSKLTVRDIDFHFDDDIPFIFNPSNRVWSKMANALSLFASHYEGYIVLGVKRAKPLITDAVLSDELQLFCRQEATHSRHHNSHLKLILKKYPELETAHQKIRLAYGDMRARKSHQYNLAYSAVTECMVGPMVSFAIQNHDALFMGGDKRMESFFLWHFVEEYEHRESALDYYNAAYPHGGLYRLRQTPHIVHHFLSTFWIAVRAVDEVIKKHEAELMTAPAIESPNIPLASWLLLVGRLLKTISPYYDAQHLPVPARAAKWFVDEARGMDMSLYGS